MECSFINVNFASFLHLLLFSFGFSSVVYFRHTYLFWVWNPKLTNPKLVTNHNFVYFCHIFILSLESQTHKSQTHDQPQFCLELPPDLIRPPTPPPPQSWLEGSVSVLLLGRWESDCQLLHKPTPNSSAQNMPNKQC